MVCVTKAKASMILSQNMRKKKQRFSLWNVIKKDVQVSKLTAASKRFRIKGPMTLRGFFKQRKMSNDSIHSKESNGSSENEETQSSLMTPSYDESLDDALPTNTNFNFNCKILRRLFRVRT